MEQPNLYHLLNYLDLMKKYNFNRHILNNVSYFKAKKFEYLIIDFCSMIKLKHEVNIHILYVTSIFKLFFKKILI